MRLTKLFAAVALLAIGSSANAQFTQTSPNGSTSSSGYGAEGWNSFWVEYNPIKITFDGDDDVHLSFTGFSAGFSHAFSISQEMPLLIEAGIGLQYANYSKQKEDITILSGKVPVNILYNFALPNSSIAIAPYAGILLRLNISGPFKYDGESEGDLFDDDDWNRFQIGWHIGVKAQLGQNFLVGISYGNDFSEIAEDTKVQTTSISVGYTF